jgi:hypothetical protein
MGHSRRGNGVYGSSARDGYGVYGHSRSGVGVFGTSTGNAGVSGHSDSGAGVYGNSEQGDAGFFEGNVRVTGEIYSEQADCAEDFDIAATAAVEPGTVMVIADEGTLRPSEQAYDTRVAGVIAGAGAYHSGLVLDRQPSAPHRRPVALMGKVYCKVDAQYAPIQVGDLLTTSPTPGHAMKAADPLQAVGALIGKALRPLEAGQGLIPILVAMQ